MADLRIFYRILGIAEEIIEPSYYHILGIERKDITAEKVLDNPQTVVRVNPPVLKPALPGDYFSVYY